MSVMSRLAAMAVAAVVGFAGASAQAMSFRVLSVENAVACRPKCPAVIVAQGEIVANSDREFIDFVRQNLGKSPRNIVLIHSPGGSVHGALKLGLTWRQLGTTVIVARPSSDGGGPGATSTDGLAAARCLSACTFAIMGAKTRIIPAQSMVGVHQTHTIQYEREIGENSTLTKLMGSNRDSELLRRYTKAMGVDPAIVALAQSIPPQSLHVLTRAEIKRFRLGK